MTEDSSTNPVTEVRVVALTVRTNLEFLPGTCEVVGSELEGNLVLDSLSGRLWQHLVEQPDLPLFLVHEHRARLARLLQFLELFFGQVALADERDRHVGLGLGALDRRQQHPIGEFLGSSHRGVEVRFEFADVVPGSLRKLLACLRVDLHALGRQSLDKHREPELVRQAVRLSEPLDQLSLEVDDVGVGVRSGGRHEGILEAVLDLVAEPDEEGDVLPGWVGIGELSFQALRKIPSLPGAVRVPHVAPVLLTEEDWLVTAYPVCVKEVLPCKMHVDYEVEVAPPVTGTVVEVDRQARLTSRLLHRVVPLRPRCHQPSPRRVSTVRSFS